MFFLQDGPWYHLEVGYSYIYERIYYRSPADTMINRIIEYDMVSAGFNSLIQTEAVHPNIIESLRVMDKKPRNVAIGNMIRKNKVLGKTIQNNITETRRLLFKANGINEEDVLSIKNDAVFIIGRKLKTLDFDKMHFIEKNVYSSFHAFDNIEMYYDNQDGRVDIKGISDFILEYHEDYMLDFLMNCFNFIEKGMDEKLTKYLIKFSNEYKARELHVGYYRELSNSNHYKSRESIKHGNREMVIAYKKITREDLADINIAYNYKMYVLPLINRYL